MFAFVRRILSILTLSACCGWSATLEVATNNRVLISVPSFSGQRLAVDASFNLVNWSEITNAPAPAAASPLTVHDPDGAGQAKRFFRLADADESYEVKGFVRGPGSFGPMANAQIIAAKDGGFAETWSDANGFFHFDQRFARTNFPLSLAAYGPAGSVEKFVDSTEAGVFVAFELPLAPLPAFVPLVGAKYDFSVKTGPRAGQNYSISFTRDRFALTGDVTGSGSFYTQWNPTQFMLRFDESGTWSQMRLWSSGNNNEFLFAGIPSASGVLPGNGVATITPPSFFAPPQLATITMTYPFEGAPGPSFTLQFSGGSSGRFTVTGGTAPFPAQSGIFTYDTLGIAAQLRLSFESENPSTCAFDLYFMNETIGTFQFQGGSIFSGTFSYSTNLVEVAPRSLDGHAYAFGDYTMIFQGQSFTLKSEATGMNRGTVFYSRSGNRILAQLNVGTGTTTTTGTDTGTTTTTGTDTGTSTTTSTSTSTGTTTGTNTGTTTGGGTGTTTGIITSPGGGFGTETGTGTAGQVDNGPGLADFTFATSDSGMVVFNLGALPSYTGPFHEVPFGVTAPAVLQSVKLVYAESLFGPAAVTITLTGGTSGTFTATEQAVGQGFFTYAVLGNTARLLLNYTGDFQGDYDDLLLNFAEDPGLPAVNPFTGTQRVTTTVGPCYGKFSYVVP